MSRVSSIALKFEAMSSACNFKVGIATICGILGVEFKRAFSYKINYLRLSVSTVYTSISCLIEFFVFFFVWFNSSSMSCLNFSTCSGYQREYKLSYSLSYKLTLNLFCLRSLSSSSFNCSCLEEGRI